MLTKIIEMHSNIQKGNHTTSQLSAIIIWEIIMEDVPSFRLRSGKKNYVATFKQRRGATNKICKYLVLLDESTAILTAKLGVKNSWKTFKNQKALKKCILSSADLWKTTEQHNIIYNHSKLGYILAIYMAVHVEVCVNWKKCCTTSTN